jgi:hypothetical protein
MKLCVSRNSFGMTIWPCGQGVARIHDSLVVATFMRASAVHLAVSRQSVQLNFILPHDNILRLDDCSGL